MLKRTFCKHKRNAGCLGFQLWCHGGMLGIDLYDDLHILDSDGMWTSVDCKHRPSGRAAHGAVCHGRFIYIFGGLGNSGALNDMWRLHVGEFTIL